MDQPQKFISKKTDLMIENCPQCGTKDLYRQKDFPRKIAIPIVIIAAIFVPWTYGFSLIVAAVIDFIIYRKTSWMTVCYKCRSEYRGYSMNPNHKDFDRHTDELYKYGT